MNLTEIKKNSPVENLERQRFLKSNSYAKSSAAMIFFFCQELENWIVQKKGVAIRDKPLNNREKIQCIKNIDKLIKSKLHDS